MSRTFKDRDEKQRARDEAFKVYEETHTLGDLNRAILADLAASDTGAKPPDRPLSYQPFAMLAGKGRR